MTQKPFLLTISLLLFSGLAGLCLAADPLVSNVTMAQRTDGSGLVDIGYDVSDADGDILAIALNISADGGTTWHFPCISLDGDVGPGVASGAGKNIVWDLALDAPGIESQTLQARVVASDAGVVHSTHSPENYWAMEFGFQDLTDQNTLERIAKSDVFVFTGRYLWGHEAHEQARVIEKMKEINPDLVVLAYCLAKTADIRWADEPIGSYARTMYDRTRPYWTYTTEGDTLMDWDYQVVLNVLEPGCREAIAGTIEEFSQASNNQVDGIFWDYFPTKIWIAFHIRDQVIGDPDLNGDGISMYADPGEIAAFQAGCDSLVMHTRDILGNDFIQVFNGPRAHVDSTFAALGDGMYYEIFPTQVFPSPDMANALNPDYEFNLFRTMTWPRTDNGGPYNVLGNMKQSLYFDQNGQATHINYGNLFRAVGLLTGNYSTWLANGGHFFDWPGVEVNLGEPVGPTVIEGNVYSRDFQYGTIELIMDPGIHPNPFSYEIKINGRLVEAFDLPFHFP